MGQLSLINKYFIQLINLRFQLETTIAMEKGNESKLQATAKALKQLDLKEFQYHKKTVEEVVKDLQTNLKTGLTQAEAEKRLEKYGHNQLEKEEEESLWEKIKESFEDLLVRILLLAAVISFIIALIGK